MKARVIKSIGLIMTVTTFFFQPYSATGQDIEHLKLNNKVSLHGNLNLQLEYYHASEIDPRKKEFSWLINGNPTLNLFGIHGLRFHSYSQTSKINFISRLISLALVLITDG